MNAQPTTLGHRVVEKSVRFGIAVVGLLVLRIILSALPMLQSPVMWMPSVTNSTISNPLISGNPVQWAQVQTAMSEALRTALQGALPTQTSALLIQSHMAIFPITIANAVVDTLIFLMLVLFGRDLASIFRSGYAKFPDLGRLLNLVLLTIIVALAYRSYQGIFYPLLWPDNLSIYGWVFLVLVLAPLVGIAVLVARNMDGLTAAVMHSGASATTSSGPIVSVGCGHTIEAGSKFCRTCGAPVNVAASTETAAKKFCASCGAQNPVGAKFCRSCGQGTV